MTPRDTDLRGPAWRRFPLIGNLGYPIIRKEVASLVRRKRWLWAQFIALAIITAGMTIIHISSVGERTTAEAIGADLVAGFFWLQFALVFLIFPGLADTPLVLKRPTPTPPEVMAHALDPDDVARACLFVATLPPRCHVPELILLPSRL